MNDSSNSSSLQLLRRAQEGSLTAEGDLLSRYRERLLVLATSRLPHDMRTRLDPEDVIQSACRVFVGRMRDGHVSVEHPGELWQLLVRVTLNKIRSEVRKHRRAKRSVFAEQSVSGQPIEAGGPTAEEAYLLIETVRETLDTLTDFRYQKILMKRLQGESTREIAKAVGLSVERVRQVIRMIQQQISESLCPPDEGESTSDV